MNSSTLVLTFVIPLVAGSIGTLLMWARRNPRLSDASRSWLRIVALLALCAGLLAAAAYLALMPDAVSLTLLDITFVTSAPARYGLTAANVALLCAALYYWAGTSILQEAEASRGERWIPLALGGIATLLACAGLSRSLLAATLMLLMSALLVALLAIWTAKLYPTLAKVGADVEDGSEDVAEIITQARGHAGALKHIALAVIAAAVWLGGAAFVSRYGFNLENRGLLQFGVGLLAVGLLLWAGSMPFAASWGDLRETAPAAAIVALGACVPVALIVGLLALSPVEGTLARGAAAGWLGAAGALLAGLRALGAARRPSKPFPGDEHASRRANLDAMTVAVAVSWAVYGVLSGSQTGAVGAILLATNIALAVPLLIVGGTYARTVAIVALLGLPPFGGAVGAMMVGQAAANSGGLWLAFMLVGSAMVGAAWLMHAGHPAPRKTVEEAEEAEGGTWVQRITDPVLLLSTALVATQIALFLASSSRIVPLMNWAVVPWLTAP